MANRQTIEAGDTITIIHLLGFQGDYTGFTVFLTKAAGNTFLLINLHPHKGFFRKPTQHSPHRAERGTPEPWARKEYEIAEERQREHSNGENGNSGEIVLLCHDPVEAEVVEGGGEQVIDESDDR